MFGKLKSDIDENRKEVITKGIVLKEKKTDYIYDAWELVHQNKFPNEKKNQQMKDSIILSHLLRFAEVFLKIDIINNIYFVTFDRFSDSKTRNFPEHSTSQGHSKAHIEIRNSISEILSV